MASNSSKIDVSKVLPDDNEIVSKNLLFRNLISKYSSPEKNKDELGLPIDDALKQYWFDDSEDSSLASDVVSDHDAQESDSSYDYEDAQKQLTVAVQQRSEQWKTNGLDKILNDVRFKLSTTFVEDWLKQNCANSNKQLEMQRTTVVAAHDGESTMDLTQQSNLTIRTDANQQSFSATDSSNFVASGNKKKIVIRQVEKTTLTTVATFEDEHGATLSLGSFPSFDLQGLSSFAGFEGFKIPNPVGELRHISLKAPKPKLLAIKDVAHSTRNENTGNRHIGIAKEGGKPSVNTPSCVGKKPPKNMTIRSASNDSDDKISMPAAKHHETHKQSVNKPSRGGKKPPKNTTIRSVVNNDEENMPIHKQSVNKPSLAVHKSPKKMIFSRNNSDDAENRRETCKQSSETLRKLRIRSSDDESAGTVQNLRTLVDGTSEKNSSKSAKSKSKPSKHALRLLKSNNTTVINDSSIVAKAEEPIVIGSSSDEYTEPSENVAKSRTQQKLQSDARVGVLREKSNVPVQSEKYTMPLDCQKRLTVGGRCRYNIEGTVIYRPRRIQANLPKDAQKIEITEQDLDLSAVASESKRKKFENFKRRIHPNSTVVYYMSDSEAEVNEGDELSDEEDDIISSFHPFVVYEYAYNVV